MGEIALPAIGEMAEGEALEAFSVDDLSRGFGDGEMAEDMPHAIGRQFFPLRVPGAVLKAIEIVQQRSAVNPWGIVLLSEVGANIGEQLKADGGWISEAGKGFRTEDERGGVILRSGGVAMGPG